MQDRADLNRDVLKSETASFAVPSIELDMDYGTLGGRFTTIEGLITLVHENLSSSNPFVMGDSAAAGARSKWDDFLAKLHCLLDVAEPYTVVIDDPLANSHVQSLHDPDPALTVSDYTRTAEQDEFFGIADMDC